MDIQQEINFKLKENFEKEEIEFAYPTHNVFIAKKDKNNYQEIKLLPK